MVCLIKTPDAKLQEINRTTNRIIWHDFAVLKMIHSDILWPIYIGNIDIRWRDEKTLNMMKCLRTCEAKNRVNDYICFLGINWNASDVKNEVVY